MGWWGFVVSTFGLLWWRTVVVVLRVIGILEEDEARVEIPRARARARARRRVAAWDDGERADLVAGGMEAEVEENEEEREEE